MIHLQATLLSVLFLIPISFSSAHAADQLKLEMPPAPVPVFNTLTDPIKGPARAPVMLIEYADFECPFCRQFEQTLDTVIRQNRNRVSRVYRHYPLEAIHKNAVMAAKAADCAFRQGGDKAFWRYSDALFAAADLESFHYSAQARKQGLKRVQFNGCLENADLTMAMQALAHNAKQSDITGTPTTIIVNRKTGEQTRVTGAVSVETLQAEIDKILQTLP